MRLLWQQSKAILPAILCLVVIASSGRAEETHWSFVPINRPSPRKVSPALKPRNPIDHFLLQRLEVEGISPSPEADPITLLRRVTMDLIGLPPSPQDVETYLNDPASDRFELAVDRLLASPHYGEKWAVPWLDLCHFAETDGYLTDQLRPVAWRYRSWLIDALNSNMPFDEFTIQQIAGDLLPKATMSQRLATGFLRQTLSNREGGAEPEEFRVKQVVDRTEMVGTIWLGLTVGCARCHDHKYDPIEQREFFQLYACLNNADEVNIDAPLAAERATFVETRDAYNRRRSELIDSVREEAEGLQRRWEQKCLHAKDNPGEDHVWDRQWELAGLVWGGGLGEGQLEGQEIMKLPWPQRTPRQKDDLLDYFLKSGSVVDDAVYRRLNLGGLNEKLKKLKDEFPKATRAPVMQASLTHRKTFVQERGEFRDPGPEVQPDVPACLPRWTTSADEDSRLTLARWLVSRDNPLTARVTVNRMWEQFFGRGLVLTTEDFGLRSSGPSHPALLDWLAAEFMDSGWNVKAMHRLIVCSAAYRRESGIRTDLTAIDPNNILLARQNALRLSAEAVRDCGLAACGLLNRKVGGPSVRPHQSARVTMEGFGNHEWKTSAAPDCYRRGLYTFRIRTTPFAQGVTFDAPSPNEICTRRARSNTPLQALTLLNDPVFYEMAQAFADRVLRAEYPGDNDRLKYAFTLCLVREPKDAELRQLDDYLRRLRNRFSTSPSSLPELTFSFDTAASSAEKAAWTNVCSVLLNLHEFITRH